VCWPACLNVGNRGSVYKYSNNVVYVDCVLT
jgi:hypothetical protein